MFTTFFKKARPLCSRNRPLETGVTSGTVANRVQWAARLTGAALLAVGAWSVAPTLPTALGLNLQHLLVPLVGCAMFSFGKGNDGRSGEQSLQYAYDELEARVLERTVELLQRTQELESARRELEEKTTQLALAQSQLETAQAQCEGLTSMIVHDLRTPLTSLLFGLETLSFLGPLNQAQHECLQTAVQGSKTSLSMMNDLLDLQRKEHGVLPFARQNVFPVNLIEAAVAQVQANAQLKGVNIHCELPELPRLMGDEPKLQRVLVNLLNHALGEAPRDSAVTVASAVRETEGQRHWLCRINDHGPLMEHEEAARVFEMWNQTQRALAAEDTPGKTLDEEFRRFSTGIEMVFCKMVVEAHSGFIWVESVEGEGNTYGFSIPL